MAIFEITIPRRLLCRWPKNKEIKLIDCTFTQGNDPYEFFVKTEMAAENEDEARTFGYEKCEDAIDFFRFCTGEDVLTPSTQVTIRKKGSPHSTGTLTIGANALIAAQEPLTTEQLEDLCSAQATIDDEKDEVEKESLKRAIHWYTRGHLEMESKIDRFIKFWIGLEVLVASEDGKNDVAKIKNRLRYIYRESDRQKLDDVIGRIYGTRKRIVHNGIRHPKDLDKKLEQLENIFADLLRARLNLKPKFLAKHHLV